MKTVRARLSAVAVAMIAAVAVTASGSAAMAVDEADSRGGQNTVTERLTGYQEDPLVLSTTGAGQIRLRIDERAQEITYTLSYTSLAGTVTQAHIHFGGKAQSGGVSAFLCSNLPNPPA